MKSIVKKLFVGISVLANMVVLGVVTPVSAQCVQTTSGWQTTKQGYTCDQNGNEVTLKEAVDNNNANNADSGGSSGGGDCVSTSIIGGGQYCDNGSGDGIMHVLGIAVDVLTFGVGTAAVVGIVISAIQYITAADNAGQLQKAKMRIFHIVIGLAIYAIFWGILQFLLPGGLLNIG